MAKFVLRKLGSTGDTCTCVTEHELAERLQPELEQVLGSI